MWSKRILVLVAVLAVGVLVYPFQAALARMSDSLSPQNGAATETRPGRSANQNQMNAYPQQSRKTRSEAQPQEQPRARAGVSQAKARQAGAAGAAVYVSPVSVAAIQVKLRQMGYTPGKPDGQWGRMSAQAVRQFQQQRGLAPTGNLNIETIQALGMPQVLKGAVERTGFLQTKKLDSQSGAQLYISPAGVRQVQDQLKQKGYYEDAVDGNLGPATRQAIAAYEKGAGLPPTGNLTMNLIDSLKLNKLTAELVGVGSPEVVARERQLRIFDHQQPGASSPNAQAQASQQNQGRQAQGYYGGQAEMGTGAAGGAPLYVDPPTVSEVQRELKRNGYDPGQVDGIWGANTRQALKQFQRARSLEPTGNLNITTARILIGGLETNPSQAGQMSGSAPKNQ